MKKWFLLSTLIPAILMAQDSVMTPQLLWELGRVGLEDVDAAGENFIYGVTNYDIEENKGHKNLFLQNVSDGEVKHLTDREKSSSNAQFIGDKIGFAYDGQYYLMNRDGGVATAITDIEGGLSGVKVFPQEDGELALLFTKKFKVRQSPEDLYPQYDKAEFRVIDEMMYRHWDKWDDYKASHLCLAYYDGETVTEYTDLMEGEEYECPVPPFGGSSAYTMDPTGRYVVYESKKVTGKEFSESTNSNLYAVDLQEGTTQMITENLMGYDKSPSFSPEGDQLAFLSMATDGYESDVNDLVVMDWPSQENKVHILEESGHFDDFTFSGFRWADDRTIYVNLPKDGTNQIYEVDVKRTALEPVISTQHNYNHFEVAGKNLIGERQDMNHATEIYGIDVRKGEAEQLTHVNDDIYESIDLSNISKVMVETTDDKEMLTWVIYPPDFDPEKKYPTLLYCQGGPQSMVSQFYSFRWNFQLMAAQGYVVVAPNRRGLPGFGRKWNEQISGDWGGQAMEDYLAAIDALSEEYYVDTENLGCVGASYGGYSVYMLAGIHEDRFSAFISHAGLFDLESWYLTTEEMWFANKDLGGPFWKEENEEDYERFDPKDYVKNRDTPMMVIHGAKDFRVPENQGMEAFQAAKLRDVPTKFLYFPNEGHWILSPQNGLVWHDQFFGWLDKWLK